MQGDAKLFLQQFNPHFELGAVGLGAASNGEDFAEVRRVSLGRRQPQGISLHNLCGQQTLNSPELWNHRAS